MLSGERCCKNDIGGNGKHICSAFQKAELRTNLKKRRFHANAFRIGLLSPNDRMYHNITHPGNGLYFRNITDGIRETVCKRRESRCSGHIDSFPVRMFSRHRKLLPDITADDDYKSQAHSQSDEFNGSVQLVAG